MNYGNVPKARGLVVVRPALGALGSGLSIAGIWSGISLFAAGCGSSPSTRLPADTYDEYTTPLTDAVIGNSKGTVFIGSDGRTTALDAGVPVTPPTSGPGGGSGSSSGSGAAEDAGIFGDDGGPSFFDDSGVTSVDGGPVTSGPFGQWHFDDCSPTSTVLLDSGGGPNAQHALRSACVPGVAGLGVQFRTTKDIVEVPDAPEFDVAQRVAVAAWVHPNSVIGDQPIVLKRLNNRTAFSLGIHNKNIEMSVVASNGTTYISQAPIQAGAWTHVAGMFDGTFVYLFINGQQFGQVYAAGTLRDVNAPVRIGATTQNQHFDGIIDEVFLSTQAITKDQLTALACIHNPPTVAVNPTDSGPQPIGSTFSYDIAATDNDFGACGNTFVDAFANAGQLDTQISAFFSNPFGNIAPGATTHISLGVSSSFDADPGSYTIPFTLFFSGPTSEEAVSEQVTYDLQPPPGCFVSTRSELMILDPSVVDDPVRAPAPPMANLGDGGIIAPPPFGGGSSGATSGSSSATFPIAPSPKLAVAAIDASSTGTTGSAGVWTFGQLIRSVAKTPDDAPAMVEQLFDTWLTDQNVNGFTVAARPLMQQTLLDIWPRTATGQLDLDRAPLRLQAIVNRLDLRNLAAGSAGEGRIVFGVDDSQGFPQNFTVILEYNLPAQTQQDVMDWANTWHALGSHPFPSEEYNAALEAVTQRFAGRNAQPSGINGSALLTLRTNEQVLSPSGVWELREFALSPDTGRLQEVTVKETPDLSFNNSDTFAAFVNQNADAIIAEVPGATGVVPASFNGAPFLAGSIFNGLIEWNAPGITNPDARFHASLNTCNGCHGPETNTSFLMVTPRSPGSAATLSPFLTGTVALDRLTGQTRSLNDLFRRKADLSSLVCGTSPDAGVPVPPVPDAGIPLPPLPDAGPVVFDAGVPPVGKVP